MFELQKASYTVRETDSNSSLLEWNFFGTTVGFSSIVP